MLKYKINIADALERKGFNTYKAKTSKLLSQDTLKKIKREDTNISLESINRICMILDMQPKDLIEYVENEEEKNKYNFWNISLQSYKSMLLYNCPKKTRTIKTEYSKKARAAKVKSMKITTLNSIKTKWSGILKLDTEGVDFGQDIC